MPEFAKLQYFCSGICLFMLSATATADSEEAIARCSKIASVGDRIICLENALRQVSPETDQAERSEEAVKPSDTDVPPDESQSSASVNQPTDIDSDLPDVETESTPTDRGAPVSDDLEPKDQRPPKEIEAMKVTVTTLRRGLNNRYVFETTNGQVWLQTDQRNVRLGDAPFAAEIRPASMGSFYLKPDAGNVSIRVRREK